MTDLKKLLGKMKNSLEGLSSRINDQWAPRGDAENIQETEDGKEPQDKPTYEKREHRDEI